MTLQLIGAFACLCALPFIFMRVLLDMVRDNFKWSIRILIIVIVVPLLVVAYQTFFP